MPASQLRGLWRVLEESGHENKRDEHTGQKVETEILEEELQACEAEVHEELGWRERVLGRLYPFRLETSGTNWRLSRAPAPRDESVRAGRSFYRFCLLVSALRDERIPDRDLTKQAEREFEQVARTGAGTLGGDAIAFGSPREDGASFRAALEDVGSRLGWTPHQDNPLWSSGKEKDAGVDVIAWRDFPDRRPGRVVLLGQAATGRGWGEKGVNPSEFLSWFSYPRPGDCLRALFTPFPQHHACGGQKGHPFEDVARAEAWKRERSLGLVVDRLRIVGTAAAHLERSPSGDAAPPIRRLDEWVRRACVAAGGAA